MLSLVSSCIPTHSPDTLLVVSSSDLSAQGPSGCPPWPGLVWHAEDPVHWQS